MENRILIVDSGYELLDVAIQGWREQGFTSTVASNMEEGLKALQRQDFYLIMITMTAENRVSVLSHIQLMRDMTNAPIIVLSTETDLTTKVITFGGGADHYTLCPCTVEEGIATGLALIRRYTSYNHQNKRPVTLIYDQSFLMCVERRKVLIKGKPVDLSYLEFEILKFLLENQGRAMSYDQIYRHVWGEAYVGSDKNTLRTRIELLRKKLHISPELPNYIKTIPNYGYSFDPHNG